MIAATTQTTNTQASKEEYNMHIRTVGELHDTINAQAKEIEQLKIKLSDAIKKRNCTRDIFTAYRRTHQEPRLENRTDKLQVYILENNMTGKTNKKTTLELANKFHLSFSTVKNAWSEINRENKALRGAF